MGLTQFQPVKPRWWERLGIVPRHRYILSYGAAFNGPPTEAAPLKPQTLTRNFKTIAVTPMVSRNQDPLIGDEIETEVSIELAIYGLTKIGTLRRGMKEIQAALERAGVRSKPRLWQWGLTPQ